MSRISYLSRSNDSIKARCVVPVLDSEREEENLFSLAILLKNSRDRLRERLPRLDEPEASWVARENMRSLLSQFATQIDTIVERSPLFSHARTESKQWLHSLREMTRGTLEKQEGLNELRRIAHEMLSRAEHILSSHLEVNQEEREEGQDKKHSPAIRAEAKAHLRKKRGSQ